MATQTRQVIGKVIVYDGDNAAELAAAVGAASVPAPDTDSAIVLNVPLPLGGVVAVPFYPGSGLVLRPPAGFLPISAEQLKQFPVDKPETRK